MNRVLLVRLSGEGEEKERGAYAPLKRPLNYRLFYWLLFYVKGNVVQTVIVITPPGGEV